MKGKEDGSNAEKGERSKGREEYIMKKHAVKTKADKREWYKEKTKKRGVEGLRYEGRGILECIH